MDGLATARQIRQIVGDELPIIVLTAYDWMDIEEDTRDAGVSAFLPKPLFKSRLYQVMHDLAVGKESLTELAATGDIWQYEGSNYAIIRSFYHSTFHRLIKLRLY